MIFLEERTIVLNNKATKIDRFEVWWRTSQGLTDSLETALEMAQLHKSELVLAVPVAIDEEGRYEAL